MYTGLAEILTWGLVARAPGLRECTVAARRTKVMLAGGILTGPGLAQKEGRFTLAGSSMGWVFTAVSGYVRRARSHPPPLLAALASVTEFMPVFAFLMGTLDVVHQGLAFPFVKLTLASAPERYDNVSSRRL